MRRLRRTRRSEVVDEETAERAGREGSGLWARCACGAFVRALIGKPVAVHDLCDPRLVFGFVVCCRACDPDAPGVPFRSCE